MNRAVLFETTGLIPIEAFTTFGINAKPNEKNPIGFFGTGLKYAVAVILRHGLKMRVFIGDTEYEFVLSKESFRGKDFEFIIMRKRTHSVWGKVTSKWNSVKMSFTTELGKTWKLWQAFRELESNTRDEHGVTLTIPVGDEYLLHLGKDKTVIMVEGDEFAEVVDHMDDVFLDKNQITLKLATSQFEVFNAPSKYVYYRGLRVHELPKETPSMYTYNLIGHHELTEDRTLKYTWVLKSDLAELVVTSNDKGFIHSVTQAKEGHFESTLDFDYVSEKPSDTFMDTVQRRVAKNYYVSPRVSSYYDRYTPPPPMTLSKPGDDAPLVEKWQWWLDSDNIEDNELKALIRDTIMHLKGETSVKETDGGLVSELGFDRSLPDKIPF